jgi:hypothetical protein
MNQALSSTLPVWPRSKSLVSALEARELIALSAPMTGTAVINMGMSITDTVMMGWIGPDALLPAARLGAEVLGVDIARNLVEAGNKRPKAESLTNCKFHEGDATNLHELKDGSFDLVMSIFGAMFAPKPFDVAKEMVRVPDPEVGSSWGTGFPMIRYWSRRS